jgi:Glycosyl hydrolase family 9/Cellulase N-terminal ig-like domain
MAILRRAILGAALLFALKSSAADLQFSDDEPLRLPAVGSFQLRIISPAVLELTYVTAVKQGADRPDQWDFPKRDGQLQLPSPDEFTVTVDGKRVVVKNVGFKRRVLYAPFKRWDLRLANYLYLQVATPIQENETVDVKNPTQKLWPADLRFVTKADPLRWNPVVHVNQTGYLPAYPKKAMVGYYLGSLGELDPSSLKSTNFVIIDARSTNEMFRGELVIRRDRGFAARSYQQVLEADFTAFKTPGEYRLYVKGLGTSFPFFIGDDVAGAFARTSALGIYHQRCGTVNDLPFTRFSHGECHTAPAEVPDTSRKFSSANESLKKESSDYKDNPRHTAPQLKSVVDSLYPFVNKGPVDVRGGHHDAGDYSKYTINSASFIHHLVFAADVLPGVADLDNLGLPESGDGKSDILQEAKWEADFLAKMQDADGGFYFLVYPRDREYEFDVTPDHGDPQIVFPKTTSATAAATAALAQCASSPTFKKQFPEAAALYLDKAKKGWDFLERAIAKFGKDGAYQKITHYGDEFMHDDELAWAACELFLATGDSKYHKKLEEWLNPADPANRKWGWWRLFESYGCAVRSYAFAAKAGKIKREQLQPRLLDQCEAEIIAAGEEQMRRAEASAYGTSFPDETKKARTAGWYFSSDAAFDLAVAYQLDYPIKNDPRPKLMDALIGNLNYEEGCNPVNVTYLTGLGFKRQREIVDQFAQNSRRILPPTGIPLGNIQAGMGWLYVYKKVPAELSFPADGEGQPSYPFYDRWGDTFNLSQEFVILNQARALAYQAWLMAGTSLRTQQWKSAVGQIRSLPTKALAKQVVSVGLDVDGLYVHSARIVWEAAGQEPQLGNQFTFVPGKEGPQWIEAEAQWPDGRRVFAVKNFADKR